jgi:Ca2+-transporting ATPase
MQGYDYFPSFLLAISLAVAVVPESLPAVMTVILSMGVKHMAKRKAIIRKLGAIEALGSITLIATDKTGTLTTNVMEVKEVWFDEKIIQVETLQKEFSEKNHHKASTLYMLLKNGIVCSTASLVTVKDEDTITQGEFIGDEFEVLGDPTEGALLKLAKKLGVEPDEIRKEWHLLDEIPFDSIKKRMSVIAKDGDSIAFSKGAPESILEISTKILINGREITLTEDRKKEIGSVLQQWAAQGLRVLAFSYVHNKKVKEIEQDNVFIGMTAIHDPPRKEAAEALKRAFAAGIKVVMITGDNEKTAEAIGSSIGLLNKGEAILRGDQIESYTDEQLLEVLPNTKIFARVTPFHKSRIVSLYQKLGEVVAVTGDGVNDSIALKQADVGIAMGKIGTDVARETADMVITDDNFATIVNAVEEGRNIVKRLKSSITYLLTGNLSEGLVLVTGLLFGLPYIFLPIQLLYINLISDGVPALTFAFTPSDERVMKEKPGKNILLSSSAIRYIISGGITATIIIVGLFYWLLPQGEQISRTAAFSVMAMIQTSIFIDIWFSHKSTQHSFGYFFTKLFMITILFPIIGQLIILRIPYIADLFDITIVSYSQFLFFLGIAASLYFIRQILKLVGKAF